MRKNHSNKEIGNKGEKIAISHLKKNGYQILETNFRAERGEIDISAQKENFLVYI